MRSFILYFFISFSIIGCNNSSTKLHGAWQLIRFEAQNPYVKTWEPDSIRKDFSGILLYQKKYMSLTLSAPNYSKYDFSKNPENYNLAIKRLSETTDYYNYEGTYTVDSQKKQVSHKKLAATVPAEWGTTAVRNFSFLSNDTLVLTTTEMIVGKRLRVLWRRLL
jgi:Lipocalin-like domain